MGSNLKNCSICGRLFAYQGRDVCSKCLEKEDSDYTIVRNYVRDHPGVSVVQVAEHTKIEEEKILKFLREGRLINRNMGEVISCARCGKNIYSGKYCPECLQQLDKQIQKIISSPRTNSEPTYNIQARKKERMHIKGIDY
ncbi:MAG: hypothetical protein ACOX6E_02970 [Syntrophomonadaceae bacterium]